MVVEIPIPIPTPKNTQISKWKSESSPAYILELIMQMPGFIVVLHFGVIHSAGGAEGNKW